MGEFDEQLSGILVAVDEGRYQEALAAMKALPDAWQGRGRVIIARADCLYELESDLNALREYLVYLERFPNGHGRNFALMGIVCCLKNLGLQPEAKVFLDRMDDGHEGKSNEVADSLSRLLRQQEAKAMISRYLAAEQPGARLQSA